MKIRAGFIIRETLGGMRRNKFHSLVAAVASALALIVIGAFIYSAINLSHAARGLLDSLQLQAFISLSLPTDQHDALQNQLAGLDSRWTIKYISREKAATEFAHEFDPDLFDVLGENPLPASFKIDLPAESMHPDTMETIAQKLSAISGIEEVIYDRELIGLLHSGMRKLTVWGLLAGIVMTLFAAGMTFNAIRLKIIAQVEAIRLMSLLGATPAMLHGVFWLQGAILGTLGGLASTFAILALAGLINLRGGETIQIAVPYVYLLILGGAVLGLTGSMLAVRRYLRL